VRPTPTSSRPCSANRAIPALERRLFYLPADACQVI